MTWKSIPLRELVTLQRGYDLPDQDREVGNVPIYGSAGITGYHNVAKAKAPGVLVGRSGASFGVVNYAPIDYWPHNAVMFVTDFHGNNERFVYYLLKNIDFSNYNSGSAQPSLNRNFIYPIPVKVPSLPTQRLIADILSAYDDLIENNTRRIRILEEMAQTIYQEWFERVDKESLPKGWELVNLSEIADVNSTSIKNGNEPEEINYVDIASVSTGKIDTIQPMKFSEAPGRARRIVRHGDVIWSTVRPNRKSYSLIINPPDNMIVSTGFAVLRAKTVPSSYLYLATTTEDFAGYLTNHATGSAYPAVNSSDFENAKIVLPPKELLSEFDNIVSPMFILRETLLGKNANLRQTRDLLLPRLVSGEIELKLET